MPALYTRAAYVVKEGFMETSQLLKQILNQIVNDLERNATAIDVLASGTTGQKAVTQSEMSAGKNRAAYNGLRKQIDALP